LLIALLTMIILLLISLVETVLLTAALMSKARKIIVTSFSVLLITTSVQAQDLDPRGYIWVPSNTRTVVGGLSYSYGGVVLDPTIPIKNLDADVQSFALSYVHSFSLFGLTAQAMAAQPYSWAQVSGEVQNQPDKITRSGFADMRVRLSVLILGAPAATREGIIKAPRKPIVGLSLNAVIPTGQFYSDKLINLGTNRFSIRPELALSYPIRKRWLVDVYSGVWFFSDNLSFYPGNAVRSQQPLGAFQAHISYNITPRFWVAYNTTYYVGGESSIDGTYKDDRQNNTRIGLTAVMPVGKSNSIKLAVSTGAVVRVGQDFTTISLGWQTSWFGRTPKSSVPTTE
jgi:hypothetical protein